MAYHPSFGVEVACWHGTPPHFLKFSKFFRLIPSFPNTIIRLRTRVPIPKTRKDGTAAMTAIEELVNILVSFTPEQLEMFLRDPVTESILQPVKASVPCHQEAS